MMPTEKRFQRTLEFALAVQFQSRHLFMKRNSRWHHWLSVLAFSFSFGISVAKADVVPDATLPIASQVVPGCTVCTIEGGTIRGVNLYHSFDRFSIPTGGEAYFNNGLQIQNILTRVTGNTGSTIDGLMRSNGSANLFFLNPNGIVFGPNAQLRLGGSFFATTSQRFNFADGSQFSAINPQAPPLLTISVATGLQTGAPTFRTITTQGTLQVPQDLQLDGFLNLQGSLIAGRNLTLKGNNIGGSLRILAGGSVTVTENISIQENGATQPTLEIRAGTDPNQASTLTIGRTNAQGDFLSGAISNPNGLVYLSNSSTLGGDINFGQINTTGFGFGGIPRGSVTIEARGNITSSGLFQGFGSVSGSALQSKTVTLLAGKSVIFNRPDRLTNQFGGSLLLSQNILLNRFIEAETINVIAANEIRMNGTITVEGDLIKLQAKSIELTDGAKLIADTAGPGNAGDILIKADSVKFSGTGPVASTQQALNATNSQDLISSGAFSQVLNGATGNGGKIDIQTRLLTVSKGAQISAVTNGQGHAGSINLNVTQQAEFDGVGSSKVNTLVNNNSGGSSLDKTFELFAPSGAFSSVRKDAIVRPEVRDITGSVTITTPSLRVINGARLTSSLSGTGNAGDVKINANDILLSNAGPNATTPGAVDDFSGGISVLNQGIGTGGNITINTDRLNVENGIVIAALTRGNGNAGTVTINAKESVAIDRSFLISDVQVGGTGIAGDIKITTGSLALKNTARISVDSNGTGEGGAITLATNKLSLDNKSSITAETTSGKGGNITIDAKDLVSLRRQSLLSTTAGTQNAGGDGGNITITSPFVVAVLRENSDIRANAFTGKGGNISITANQVFGLRQQLQDTPFSDITASSALGINGTININNLSLDPSQGLQALNLSPVDPSNLIAQGCNSGRRVAEGNSRFVILGRGGFSSSPDDPFSGMGVLNDLGNLVPSSMTVVPSVTQQITPSPIAASPIEIVEAQGFAKDPQGNVYLVSQSTGSRAIDPPSSPVQCQGK
jgi:filamentous hemagglutinin family protein